MTNGFVDGSICIIEEGIADVDEDDSIGFDMAAGVQLQPDLRHGEGFFTTSTTILLFYQHENGHWLYSLNWKIAWNYTHLLKGQGQRGELSNNQP